MDEHYAVAETSATTMLLIDSRTIGEAWIFVAMKILEEGASSTYDGIPTRELMMATLHVTQPDRIDELIDTFADAERLDWMHANFTDPARVRALGDADSYATRLYDYEHRGLNQIEWVIERLRRDSSTRSAVISTFQPLTDTSYIPCVSLLDFFIADHRLELAVFAHSIDFGTKGFANLVELAHLQQRVAEAIVSDIGALTMIVKSAHVYENDIQRMNDVIALAQSRHTVS